MKSPHSLRTDLLLPLFIGIFGVVLAFTVGWIDSGTEFPWVAGALAVVAHVVVAVGSFLAVRWLNWREIAGIAAVMWVVFLILAPPCGDVARYAWEGFVQTEEINPYVTPPGDLGELAEDTSADYWERINHKDKTAIYPPGAQVVLRGMATAFGTLNRPGLHMLFSGLAFAATIWVLLVLCKRIGRRREWVALFALSPVTLVAFPGEGHLDAYMVLALALALLAWKGKRWVLMFLALAAAAQLKYMALFVWPFFVNRENWRWTPVVVIAAVAPFALYTEGGSVGPIFETLRTFSSSFQYNASLHALLTAAGASLEAASALLMLAMLVGVWVIRLFNGHPMEGSVYALGWVLLCAGTVHPWYLSWVLVFAVFRPSPGWLLVTGSVGVTWISVARFHATGAWVEVPGLACFVWLPLLGGWAFRRWQLGWVPEWMGQRRTLSDAVARAPVRTVSVIIPSRNEAAHLPGLLASVVGEGRGDVPVDVLLADGGSTDGTIAMAEAAGARVVVSERPGRGHQIAAAAMEATGDLLLVVHADAQLRSGAIPRMVEAVNRSGIRGGALGARFERPTGFLRVVDALNTIRSRWGGISFGDQGQFVRRDAVAEMGGWPAMVLMEDVELSLRLKALEQPLHLGDGLVVSPRSWERAGSMSTGGKHRRALRIVWLVAHYLFLRFFLPGRVRDEAFAKAYYG